MAELIPTLNRCSEKMTPGERRMANESRFLSVMTVYVGMIFLSDGKGVTLILLF
jgi:hypothetical protein